MREQIQRTLDELEDQRQHEPERFSNTSLDERMLAVGPDTARFLNSLARAMGARRVIEVGGSMGYSTIWLAEAVEVNGGRMTTLEMAPNKIAALHRRIAQAGLETVVEVKTGDARTSLADLAGPFDLVLIDAWKDDYPAYFDLIFPKMRVGGLMLADNILTPAPPGPGIGAYVEKARSQANAQSQLVAVGNGLEMTLRRD
ncbi:MAG: O-methyltransferase [Chloroflexota bacterium]